MSRVTVYHLTAPSRLPLIEEDGLRTRADLSEYFGELSDFDRAAPGRFAHGKRVSGYLDLDHARTHIEEHGAGLVSYTVDPAKSLAAPSSLRDGDAAAYWEAAKPLREWGDDRPDDLEVHVHVPVRDKHVSLHAPLFTDEDLGEYAPLVSAVADEDRLSAKALMHLCLVRSEGVFDSPDFRAACALAWRDEPDDPGMVDELFTIGADKVASAALAEFGGDAPDASAELRETLEQVRAWADANDETHGRALFVQSALILEQLPQAIGDA